MADVKITNTPHIVNLVGQVFDRLTVTGRLPGKRRRPKWVCRCACGSPPVNVGTAQLVSGHSRSCGCLRKETTTARSTIHGGRGTPEYNIWKGMKARCLDTECLAYSYYGGRGITICDRWINSFPNFLSDMGNRTSPDHTIDRIDNDGNYCPENCRWATMAEQGRNTRNNHLITHNGLTMCLTDWAAKVGLSRSVLSDRINKRKWTIEKALNTPKKQV
jgi:hypothetical protein